MSDINEATPTSTNGFLCKADNIRKSFIGQNSLEVLAGVDLSLKIGEQVAIVGSSGTGKTTLLHILGTIDRPTSGNLYFADQDVFSLEDQPLSQFRNQSIGFVFQFHHLLPEFSALENVMLPGLIAERPKKILSEEAKQLLSQVGLPDRLHHKVGELSGGEQQRVALARAIILKPSLLLADEPTGNLDPKTGDKVFELIKDLNQAYNLTTVMVTHNHDLAASLDRCLTMSDGKLHE